jgi:hypothetical protein
MLIALTEHQLTLLLLMRIQQDKGQSYDVQIANKSLGRVTKFRHLGTTIADHPRVVAGCKE